MSNAFREMIKIKLSKTFEIDNKTFEDWCKKHQVGKWKGRVFLRDKMYEAGELYLQEQELLNKKPS